MALCMSLPVAWLWQSENWSSPIPLLREATAAQRHTRHCHQTGQQLLSISLHPSPCQTCCDCCHCPLPPTPAKCHSHTLHHAPTGKGTSHYTHWVSQRCPHCSVTIPRGGQSQRRAVTWRNTGGRVSRAWPSSVLPRKHKVGEHTTQLLWPQRLLPRNAALDGMAGLES